MCALYISLQIAPLVVDHEQVSAVLATVLEEPISERHATNAGLLYVRSDSGGLELVTTLRDKYPHLNIAPWAERPEDLGCQSARSSVAVLAPCERDDYVAAELLSFPLWRTALVSVGTFNTGGQVILVHVAGRWRVIADHRFVI